MNYKTYLPDPSLGDFVKCYWSLEAPAATIPEKQRIVPDGCMEMIFHYGDLYRQFLPDGCSIIQPRSFVFGQITEPLEIAPTGISGIIAARFQPDGFLPFASLPVQEMENRAVALDDLFGQEGIELEEKVLSAPGNDQRIKMIEEFLRHKLQTPESADRIARSSVELLLKSKGQFSVDELAGSLHINRRQLERKFAAAIGISPKQFSRITRLQAALKMLEKKEFTSLTSLAYESGYFDQAHFIKDFKEFTGMSPRQFYSDNLKLTALFVGTE